MRPTDALAPTGSCVTAVTRAEPEPELAAERVPGRRVAEPELPASAGAAAASRSTALPAGVEASRFATGELSTVRTPESVDESAGFDSTASSVDEPGRWRKPMRTAPKPTAASASTTTPTMRSTPPLFWPPPVSSALAAILLPLLVARRRRRARLRRIAGAHGRGPGRGRGVE